MPGQKEGGLNIFDETRGRGVFYGFFLTFVWVFLYVNEMLMRTFESARL